jgi:hypothetical protein
VKSSEPTERAGEARSRTVAKKPIGSLAGRHEQAAEEAGDDAE